MADPTARDIEEARALWRIIGEHHERGCDACERRIDAIARALAAREAAVREAIAAWHDAEAHSFAVANAGQWVTAYRKRMTFLLHRLHQRCAAAIRAQGGGA